MTGSVMRKWLLLSLLVIVLDQLTKFIADANLVYGSPLAVFPSFNLTLLYNRGAAFSFLGDASGWQRWFFITISTAASVFIFFWLRKIGAKQPLLSLALALILGGAIGNLIDRVWFGHVIDFIQLYYQTFYWPAFNIADSAISVGAVLIIRDAFFGSGRKAS